ncbi:hypothetical protein [Alysiella filiformis]|uniref:Lipoprotein n=1 Tax=Alysiella filiformis DSM 16848 TaxID=1120981 RepID=A0A286EAW0_9NEIS|nr:hypothetical protein [Alysiella filiformis]QMT32262.1 hypothetical protein H3L97_05375 [Alysiella filiformis]UBQ56817.1 hypothetical protein JF568_03310 [Alysiella filiformis DSM 16848]SOD68006.1 hypothetical protein SAMN02746062_01087 [Alysiella filiformis DSM 16848]
MKKAWFIIMLMMLNACASSHPNLSTRQKVIYGANVIVYTPLCFLYGICPDISPEE